MEVITFTLNGAPVSARADKTILEVAREHGIEIPTLCHHELLGPVGACRLCQVEDERRGVVVPACVTTVQAGMVIKTHSPRVVRNRKNILRLLLSSHPESCLVCDKGNRCELRKLAAQMGIGEHGLDRMPYHPSVSDINPLLCRDLSKCILCAKCIRADQEVVVEGVIDYHQRGFDAHPATLFLGPLEDSNCTLCGTCLSVCPTGALQEKGRHRLDHAGARTPSICSFCACGCSIYLEHNQTEVLGVSPTARPQSANGISLCIKGHFGHDYLNSPDRLNTPLIRTDEGFKPLGWEEALDLASSRLKEIAAAQGGGALGFIGGSRSTNEENYLFQKLARDVFATNNVDSVSRLYWGRAAGVLREAAGLAAGTGSLKDLEESDVILVAGADPSRTAPVVAYHIRRAVKFGGKKLLLLDPRQTKLAPLAEVWLRPDITAEESADGAALKGLIKAVLEEGLEDHFPSGKRAEAFEELRAAFEPVSTAECASMAGLDLEELRRAAGIMATAGRLFILFGSGLMQQPAAEELTRLLLALARLPELFGRERAGLLPLLKDCNTQGAIDMGVAPDILPGHRAAGGEPGLDALKMFSATAEGRIKAMYVLAENPVGLLPDPDSVKRALSELDFLVVQDLFMTETAELADLVLPAAGQAEKQGTVTNLERRVQYLQQAVPPPEDFPPEWRVLTELGRRLGHDWPYESAAAVMAEVQSQAPSYQGLAGPKLEGEPFFWPLSSLAEAAGGPVEKKAVSSAPRPDKKAGRAAKDGYPLVLMQGHLLQHLGSGARTSHSRRLYQVAPREFIGLSQADLEEYGLEGGERVRLVSRHGSLEAEVRSDPSLPQGVVFAPASFPGWRPGLLFGPDSAGLKHCRVRLERV